MGGQAITAISCCSQYLGSLHVAKPAGTGILPRALEMTDDSAQAETQGDWNQVCVVAVTCLSLDSDSATVSP